MDLNTIIPTSNDFILGITQCNVKNREALDLHLQEVFDRKTGSQMKKKRRKMKPEIKQTNSR